MVIVITKLKILNYRLKTLKMADDESRPCDEFINCIEDRTKVYNLIKELEALIKSSLFLDFVVFAILLCSLLFQASQVI
jgi:hypothetical protein